MKAPSEKQVSASPPPAPQNPIAGLFSRVQRLFSGRPASQPASVFSSASDRPPSSVPDSDKDQSFNGTRDPTLAPFPTSAQTAAAAGSVVPPVPPSKPVESEVQFDVAKAARALWKAGWLSWWIQMVLTVVSGVILLFSFAFPGVNIRNSASALGFILSGVGVVFAFLSLFWTYGYTRLSLWLSRSDELQLANAPTRLTTTLRIGVGLAIAGLFVSLIGLQAIVGTLLARLFSAGIATTPYTAYQVGGAGAGAGGLIPGTGAVQPVDILIVQASANAMTALLTALVTSVWLRARSRMWEATPRKSSTGQR